MHWALWIVFPVTLGAADLEQKGARHTVKASADAAGVDLRDFHSWTLSFDPSNSIDTVAFEATMPEHGHGLAIQPTIKPLEKGSFRVEGVRFHMAGNWVLRVRLHDRNGWDSVSIPFRVEYASAVLKSLWIGARKGPRADPSNRFAGTLQRIPFW